MRERSVVAVTFPAVTYFASRAEGTSCTCETPWFTVSTTRWVTSNPSTR